MKKILSKIFPMIAAVSLGAASVASAQYWGDAPRDEQQWWNPADWYDETADTWNTWDYDYNWNDYDWYGDLEGTGGGGDISEYGYGADEASSYDYDWYANGYYPSGFDYGYEGFNDDFYYDMLD